MEKQGTRDFVLWVSVLAGPVFWLCSFQAKFSWTTWACATQSKAQFFVFALVAFLLTASAGLLARREWKALGSQEAGQAGTPLARSRFMALGGMVFSAAFCMVIFAQSIPDMILGACQ